MQTEAKIEAVSLLNRIQNLLKDNDTSDSYNNNKFNRLENNDKIKSNNNQRIINNDNQRINVKNNNEDLNNIKTR